MSPRSRSTFLDVSLTSDPIPSNFVEILVFISACFTASDMSVFLLFFALKNTDAANPSPDIINAIHDVSVFLTSFCWCSYFYRLNTDMASQKVLWESYDPWTLNQYQTITLSESIEEQKNGILMEWSKYASPDAVDYDYNYIFIPKSAPKDKRITL